MNRPEDEAPELAAEIMEKAERLEQCAQVAQVGSYGHVLETWKSVEDYSKKLIRVLNNMNPHIMEIESTPSSVAPNGTVVHYEYTGPEFEDDDLPF